MIRKATLYLSCAAFLLLGLNATSQAASFDFLKLANALNPDPSLTGVISNRVLVPPATSANGGNGLASDNGGEQGGNFTWTIDGIELSATAHQFGSNGTIAYDPYLDGGDAGLGVCSTGLTSTSFCSQGADDDITVNEVLKLSTNQDIIINSISFKNESHGIDFHDELNNDPNNDLNNGDIAKFYIRVDGDQGGTWQSFDLPHNDGTFDLTSFQGQMFEFSAQGSHGLASNQIEHEFYVSVIDATAVPIPSAFILFGTGLVGLIGWNYRRATKQ